MPVSAPRAEWSAEQKDEFRGRCLLATTVAELARRAPVCRCVTERLSEEHPSYERYLEDSRQAEDAASGELPFWKAMDACTREQAAIEKKLVRVKLKVFSEDERVFAYIDSDLRRVLAEIDGIELVDEDPHETLTVFAVKTINDSSHPDGFVIGWAHSSRSLGWIVSEFFRETRPTPKQAAMFELVAERDELKHLNVAHFTHLPLFRAEKFAQHIVDTFEAKRIDPMKASMAKGEEEE